MENEENMTVPEEGNVTNETQPEKPINIEHPMTKKQKNLRTATKWGLITISSIMMAFSVYFFQTPYNITLGGIAGIAFLLEKLVLTQGVWMLIINGALIIIGLCVLGKQCTVGTIYSSALYTGVINLMEVIGRNTNLDPHVVGDQPLLALMYAILLYGVGGAIIFNCGASSGGTDIIALIFKKYTHLNVGFALFLVDLAIVCITIYTITIEAALFSFMGLLVKAFLLDSVIEGLGRTKYITIITTMPDEIGKYITEEAQHSYTVYDARGGYTGDKKNVILTICKRNEAWKIKTAIKQIDPGSFVIISNANEIVGRGFGGTV